MDTSLTSRSPRLLLFFSAPLLLAGWSSAQTVDWTAESDRPGARLGVSVESAGDVNGDGFDDLIMGAPDYDASGTRAGRVFAYYGSATGLGATPDWSADAGIAGLGFGHDVAAAGDVNGDGFDDVVIGTDVTLFSPPVTESVYIYYGSANGLGSTPTQITYPQQPNSSFGTAASGTGDVNGDGFDDIVVGAFNYTNGQNQEGAAFLYLGSASGIVTSPHLRVESNQDFAVLGIGVGGGGDVNGDGFDDMLVGASLYDNTTMNEGAVFAYYGSPTGPAEAPSWTKFSGLFRSDFGRSVNTAGDVNGDGFDDVIVGAFSYLGGRAFVYLGSATGLSSLATWTGDSGQTGAQYGLCVGSAGDVNNDGFDDVVVGAASFGNLLSFEGSTNVYLGSNTGNLTQTFLTSYGGQVFAQLGASVAGAGDLDGDGSGDIVAGAPTFANGQSSEGRAFVFFGNSALSFPARADIFNGSSLNPLAFSASPPKINHDWTPSIDTTVRPAATQALLLIYAQESLGAVLPGGELLVDLTSSLFLSAVAPATPTGAEFSLPIPNQTSLLGARAIAQGIVLGGGYTICNAYRIKVGL